MQRVKVESSNLRSVGYDAETGTLEVEFTSGVVYQYLSVTAATHAGLMAADSKGHYFHQKIKSAGVKFRRMPDPEKATLGMGGLLPSALDSVPAADAEGIVL